MMPPHDNSTNATSDSPAAVHYASVHDASQNLITATTNSNPPKPDVDSVVGSGSVLAEQSATSSASSTEMFCSPVSNLPPPIFTTTPNKMAAAASKPLSRAAKFSPPPSDSGLYCSPIGTNNAPQVPPAATTSLKKLKPISPPATAAYHPDFMFCGSCTDCQPAEEKKMTTDNLEDYIVPDSSSDDSDNDRASAHQTRLRVTAFPANSGPSLLAHGLLLQSLLQPLAGVQSVVVTQQELQVDHTLQTSQAQLVAALKRGGYTSSIVVEDATEVTSPLGEQEIVRSQFHVGGICCAMEIPVIRKIVKPLYGVENVQINIATKMVYVQHDALCISALAIAESLTREGFPSEIQMDGAARVSKQKPPQAGRTRLQVRVPGRVLDEQVLERIRHQLEQVPGIDKISIQEDKNNILVEHDADIIEAQSIPPLVSGWDLEVVEEPDAVAIHVQKSEFVESTLIIEQLQHRNVETLQLIFRQNYIKAQVRAFFAHVSSQTIKLEHNPELIPIKDVPKMLEPYGLKAHVAVDGEEAGLYLPVLEEYGGLHHASEGMMEEEIDNTSTLKCPVILSGLFWVLSMMSAFGGIMVYFQYFGLLSVFFGLPPVARKAWRTIRRRQFDSNCMMVTAALGALALQEFDEAASVAFLFSVSEFLEARSTSKARKALKAIVQLRPDHASVIHPITKEISIVPASQVPVGSLLSVRTGDKIAADGVVVEGVSTVDESSLTGESKPIMKRKDDVVSGGTINVGTTQLVIKTTTSVEDSVVSRLIKVVEDAQSCRSHTEKMIDKFAKSYTPFVVCVAAIMCTIPWLWGAETGRYWTLNGLIIIVIACPCSLTISTPVTYAAGLAAAAQRGIIVKGGAHLEALGAVDTVIMDKTGTLTHGQFRVDHLKEIGSTHTRDEMLALLALMEAPSSHPLSATLVRAAQKEGVSIPQNADVELHTVLKGEGVTARVNGKQVYVGNKRLFERVGMYKDLPTPHQNMADEWAGDGATVGFIGIEGEGIIGAFSMIDTIRDEAHDTIHALHKSNIKVVMLTGDGKGAAHAVARQVGIPPSFVHSQLLPEDKLHYVGSQIRPDPPGLGPCKSKSKVLFVGDGINDTPALAVADVGVSMGDGAAALAMEISDVTLMDSNLTKLLYVVNMGTRVVNTIQENICISLLSKVLVVGLTFGGKMTLFGAIASDVGVMLIVTLNGMKLLPVSSDPDLEPKPKRRLRSPKFGKQSYDEVMKNDADGGGSEVELGGVRIPRDSSNPDLVAELV